MAYPGSKYNPDNASGEQSDLVSLSPDRPRTWMIPEKEKPMFQFQTTLPRLPVPPLEKTCLKFLRTCAPLAKDEEELEATKKSVLDFLLNGSGNVLQERLLSRAKSKSDSSWLIDWWNGYSYFGYRDPLVFYVSYFYQFKNFNFSQTEYAAKLIKGTLKYRELIVSKELLPEKVGDKPMDMSMYKFLFNAYRLPKIPVDEYITYDPTYYHHIIVVRKNKFFKLNLIENGVELSTADIETALQDIINAAGHDSAIPIGALTASDRDSWANNRAALIALDVANENSLRDIESSILVVCLDDKSPSTNEEKIRALWHGDGCNRFYDKQQFIVSANGEAGFLGEHGMMDGSPTLQFTNWLLGQIVNNRIDNSARVLCKSAKKTFHPRFSMVPFKTTSDTNTRIAEAQKAFLELVEGHDVYGLDFQTFGKEGIKKCKISPDGFCQMAIQLAYFRYFKHYGATYEACSTRGFLHGRTETIRSCSIESTSFCEAMVNPDCLPQEKYKRLQDAAKAHVSYVQDASNGFGVDRHLLGLKLLREDGDLPTPIFDDPLFNRTKHWILSTSTLASEHFAFWGFGEVVEDGFGIGYMCNSNNMNFVITSRHLGAKKLADHLQSAMTEMYSMCQAALSKAKL